jgi:hypothetical protein
MISFWDSSGTNCLSQPFVQSQRQISSNFGHLYMHDLHMYKLNQTIKCQTHTVWFTSWNHKYLTYWTLVQDLEEVVHITSGISSLFTDIVNTKALLVVFCLLDYNNNHKHRPSVTKALLILKAYKSVQVSPQVHTRWGCQLTDSST